MKTWSRMVASMLAFVMLFSTAFVPANAAKVTVKKVTVASSLSGNKKTVVVAKGKSVNLSTTVTVTPNKKANKKVLYSVKNKSIATVSNKGVVKGKKAGTTKITVTSSKNKKKKATITVKVMKGAVTSVKLNKTKASLNVGQTLSLKTTVKTAKGACKTIAYTTSKAKVAKVSSKGVITAIGTGNATITAKAIDGSGKRAVCKVTVGQVTEALGYDYSITPLLAPFDEYFYVKTNNPQPSNIRFVDKQSRYYTSSSKPCTIVPTRTRFLDVQYEDKKTGRVAGGYIFEREGSNMDGGELVLQTRESTAGYRYREDAYKDTTVTVSCPEVKNYAHYLIDTYTTDSMTFFEKMDAIQSALVQLALYPRAVRDSNKRSTEVPYPSLAVSPYPELSLNEHYEMYESSTERLFLDFLYPYILDSLGFPSVMRTVAYEMEPSCTVEWGEMHYLIKVTKDGVTRTYGGAGEGGNDPLYSRHVEKLFLFDGSGGDYASHGSLESIANKRNEYGKLAVADAEGYRQQLTGDNYKETVSPGSWIRVAVEGSSNTTKVFAYVTQGEGFRDDLQNKYISAVEDVWVDGRYINQCNYYEKGASFEDYPKADIMIRNMSYVNWKGEECRGDVRFCYEESSGTWKSNAYRYDGYSYHYSFLDTSELPEEFILTKEEVEAMVIDRNTNIEPETGFIYDGSVEPGTPF